MTRLPSVPFPVPFRLYYGWIIVTASVIINLAAGAMTPIVFSFMIGPMSEDLGVSRSAFSWAFTLRVIAGGMAAPLIGIIIDRHGTRWMGVLSGAVVGGSLIALSASHHLSMIYLLFFVSGSMGMSGPGGSMLTMVPVSKWFIAKRGRAIALVSGGLAGGVAMNILLANWLIEWLGWRAAWVVLGTDIAVVVCAASFFLMRRTPEDLGLVPDGGLPVGEGAAAQAARRRIAERDWTLAEAVRTPALWMTLGALALLAIGQNGTLIYRTVFWEDKGISPHTVALGTIIDPLMVIFSGIFFGMLAERVPLRFIGLMAGAGMGLGTIPMIFATSNAGFLFAHGLTWGFFAGAYMTMMNLVWPTYYGRRAVGAIRGVSLPVMVAAAATAPPLFGYLLDSGIGAAAVWTIALGLLCTSGALLFVTRPPKPPQPKRPAHRPLAKAAG